MRRWRKLTAVLLAVLCLFSLFSCSMLDIKDTVSQLVDDAVSEWDEEISDSSSKETLPEADHSSEEASMPDENGTYTTKDEVAYYIYCYGKLPDNFITKQAAQNLGWEGRALEPYAPGKCIGGDRFGNYEGLLPKKAGRTYTECDIDTLGASERGVKRIVFSNDGYIFYTDDHYESFTQLYAGDLS